MKRPFFFVVLALSAFAQSTSPNLGLTLPVRPNWDTPLYDHFRVLDNLSPLGTCGDGTGAAWWDAIIKRLQCKTRTEDASNAAIQPAATAALQYVSARG